MKKRINIALGALNFLHRVLTETGVVTKVDARKQHATFQCMDKVLGNFRERLDALRKEYRQNKPWKDPQGNEQDRWIIPEEVRVEFENKLLDLENEMVDVDFDRESLSVLSRAFDELFEKQAKLKEEGQSNGIANETTMKLINEADRAIAAATDVE